MVLFRQLSTLLCAAVLVCILKPSESQIGAACPSTGCSTVIPNSDCLNGACECKQGFYDDQGSDCLPKKGLGDACAYNDECQDSSHCDGGHCVGTANNTTVGTTTVGTTTDVTTTVGTTTAGTAGDRAVVIQGFLQYVMVNRN
ncbi:uncharacterized protein LOC112566546 isoform X2 [Pomacea canaliculata]|uniref:uncharacterized protein LOC112566546 isoform X2 n=1 Tax=Pomacea canaliculata TaxID=400727 RepID=UPI000D733073|nr:uncharacterized protein LOC112566546 isoform X2 [Pomacea canaliculata]